MKRDEVRELLQHMRLVDRMVDTEKRVDFWLETLEPMMTLPWAKSEVVRYYMTNEKPMMPAHLNAVWHQEAYHRAMEEETAKRDAETAAYLASNHDIPPEVRQLIADLRQRHEKAGRLKR